MTTSSQLLSISLKDQLLSLGRDADADLPLESPTVSRHHATIETAPGKGYIPG